MTVAALIQSLRSKKQTASRSAFQAYLSLVRELAAGQEVDGGGAESILAAASKDESDLERDVGVQQQRLSWYSQLQQHHQAAADRAVAEKDLQVAQQALQEAVDRLQPAIEQAYQRMQTADQIRLTTAQSEFRLSEHVLDAELLAREAAVVRKLSDVNAELIPLVKDRDFKQHSLQNAEFNLRKLQARKEGDWMPAGIVQFFNQPKDVRELTERVDDLKSQIRQLDSAIQPRLAEQRRLQGELSQIHAEKLLP